MKKLVSIVVLIACTLFFIPNTYAGKKGTDCIKMQNGKMWVIKDGKKTEMTANITTADYTIIAKNGTITMPDGSTKVMKNGESIGMDGKMLGKPSPMK